MSSIIPMDEKGNSEQSFEKDRHFKPKTISKNTNHDVYNTVADFSKTVVKTTDFHQQSDFHTEYKQILGQDYITDMNQNPYDKQDINAFSQSKRSRANPLFKLKKGYCTHMIEE